MPRLVVEVGDGYDFEKRLGPSDEFVRLAVGTDEGCGAFAKLVRVRETRGRSGASNVVIRLSDVSPPAPHTTSAVELVWTDHNEANDIRPSGHKYVALHRIIFFKNPAEQINGWRCTPTIFDHADTCEFTLEVLMDNKLHQRVRLRMKDNPWSYARLEAIQSPDWPPDEIDVPEVEIVE
jgi:hypothetical protein